MGEGVNRVSLGVQSFVDRECTAVGRTHTGAGMGAVAFGGGGGSYGMGA